MAVLSWIPLRQENGAAYHPTLRSTAEKYRDRYEIVDELPPGARRVPNWQEIVARLSALVER